MSALDFIGRHWESGLQLAVTAWFASIARTFQITLSTHTTRLEAHREAMRRARIIWWLGKEDPGQMETRNGMLDWISVNEVFLSPAAAEAFKTIEQWKTMVISTDYRAGEDLFKEADRAFGILRTELLRFRKLTLRETIDEWLRKRRRKPRT